MSKLVSKSTSHFSIRFPFTVKFSIKSQHSLVRARISCHYFESHSHLLQVMVMLSTPSTILYITTICFIFIFSFLDFSVSSLALLPLILKPLFLVAPFVCFVYTYCSTTMVRQVRTNVSLYPIDSCILFQDDLLG